VKVLRLLRRALKWRSWRLAWWAFEYEKKDERG